MKAILLTLLLALSCSRNVEVTRTSMGAEMNPVKMEISHLNEIEWRVGMKKEKTITQSITFIVDMPKVSDDDLEYLTKKFDVDAWIVRLIAVRGSDTQDLGSLYSLFKPRKSGRRGYNSGTASSVSMKIFYAAAYASERFRSFKCPAFNHTKKISSMEIAGENTGFSLSIGQAFPYPEKSQHVELTPSSFNGGHTLVGEYFVEIAPYNSQKKYIHSRFKRIPMSIVVEQEDLIRIESCDGIDSEIQQ